MHFTKPLLPYWFRAASIRVLGQTPGAVRLPSLIASSLEFLLLFSTTVKLAGWRPAALAAEVYSMMPLALIVARLAYGSESA